ncbi:MAG: YMGG-like glycine zipper-containing protein [Gammaproteobacteria bacterium]
MFANVRTRSLVFILIGVLLAGCNATTSQKSTAGGAVLGAIIGGALGGSKGALIGAAAGSALGWATGKVIEAQEVSTRSQTQDQQLYGYVAPADSIFVNINSATSSPKMITPNSVIEATTDFSLALPQGVDHTQVDVSGVLLKDGEKLYDFKSQPLTKTAGGYAIKMPVEIPSVAEPGTYVIQHRVTAGSTYDTAESTFVVTAG